MAAVVLFYLLFAWIKSLHFFDEGHKIYRIRFENVNGLLKGAQVNVFGYPCGSVVDISPTQEEVIVTVRLNEKIQLYADATAEIQLKELMGGKQIEIKPGRTKISLKANEWIEGDLSPDLTSAFSSFGQAVKSIDSARIERMILNMEKITQTSVQFSEAFRVDMMKQMLLELQLTAAELRRTSQTANKMMMDVEKMNPNAILGKGESILNELRTTISHTEKLIENTDLMLQSSNKMMIHADRLSQRVENKMLPHTDSLMTQVLVMLNQTDRTLKDVQSIVEALNNNMGMAGKVLHDANFALKIDSTLDRLNLTLDDIRNKKIRVGLQLRERKK